MPVTRTLDIRPAGPDDLDAVDTLFARSYPVLLKPDYPPSVLVTTIPIVARAQPKLIASGTFFVGLREGAIVAAGGWTRDGPGGAPVRHRIGHVRHVVTDHRHVRQGIGGTLMRHVMAEARAAGMRELHCQSTLTAAPFYETLGFRRVGPIMLELPRAIGFPAILMVARL